MSIIPNIILYNYYPILITWRCNRNYLALTISPNKLDLNDISITTLYYKTSILFYFFKTTSTFQFVIVTFSPHPSADGTNRCYVQCAPKF